MLTALISLLSAALAGGVTWTVGRRQQDQSEVAALCDATTDLLACLDDIAMEAERIPAASPRLKRFHQAIEARAPQLDYLIDRLARATLTRDFVLKERRFFRAANRLTLIAPDELVAAVGKCVDLLRDFEADDPQWGQRWRKSRGELQFVARQAIRCDRG